MPAMLMGPDDMIDKVFFVIIVNYLIVLWKLGNDLILYCLNVNIVDSFIVRLVQFIWWVSYFCAFKVACTNPQFSLNLNYSNTDIEILSYIKKYFGATGPKKFTHD